MGEPPPNHDPSSQSRKTSQASERSRSRDSSQPLISIPENAGPPSQQRGSRGSQGSQDLQGAGLPHWPQRSSLIPESQGEEGAEYSRSMSLGYSPGFPLEFPPQSYLDESRMMQQFPQGLLEHLETSYQDPAAELMSQLNLYQREDRQFSQAAQHGPYLRDDPTLHLGPSGLGFMPFVGEVPDPEPRELAVQNAKAYLLQTSVSCSLSL